MNPGSRGLDGIVEIDREGHIEPTTLGSLGELAGKGRSTGRRPSTESCTDPGDRKPPFIEIDDAEEGVATAVGDQEIDVSVGVSIGSGHDNVAL